MEIAVVGKQWMWKFQHPNGRREINDLHVPVGRPIHLRMISQDVIHSLFIPAFRIKQDALPMYYTSIWFEATKVGKYRIFCAEYCGKDHSIMGGWAYVMHPYDYERWLESDPAEEHLDEDRPRPVKETGLTAISKDANPLVRKGHTLFERLDCVTCHDGSEGPGPDLSQLYGSVVELSDGRTVGGDENYIRESILNPDAKIKNGFARLMPAYRGRVSEEEINALIAYIKSLRSEP